MENRRERRTKIRDMLNQESDQIPCFIHVPAGSALVRRRQQQQTRRKARLIPVWHMNQYTCRVAVKMKSDSVIILAFIYFIFFFIFYLLSGQMWCKDAVTLCTPTDMHATLSWSHTCRRSTFIRMMWNVVACESWVKRGAGEANADFQERSPDREQNRLLLHIAPFKLVFILDSLAPFTTLHSLWG